MGSPLLWGPGTSTNLQPGIQLTSVGATVLSGTVNPTTTATNGLPASLYLNTSTGVIYQKTDSGTTTNWVQTALSTLGNNVQYTGNGIVVGAGVVAYNTLVYDTFSNYNTSNGQFQPTIAGYYIVTASLFLGGGTTIIIYKNGAAYAQGQSASASAPTTVSAIVFMNGSSDILTIVNTNAGTANGGAYLNQLCISLVGGYTAGGSSGLTRSILAISTATTAGASALTDYVYLVSGTTTLTLPTAISNTNLYTVKNTGVATVSIATTSAQTIDGSASPITLPVANTSLSLISDNANWRIV